MRTDILAQLIGSLNSKEVRAVRASEYLSKGKWSAERTLLFNALLNNPDLTFEQQQARFCGNPYLKVLLKERHRMYHELLAFLLDYYRRNPESPDPWRPLDESRLLLAKGLTEQAADCAQTGIRMAEEVHDLHAQLLLREQLRSIYKLMHRQSLTKEINDNDYRLETLVRQVTNLTSYNYLSDRIFDLMRKYRLADDNSVRSAIDAMMQDELMTNMSYAISLPAQIKFVSIRAYYAQCIGQLEEAMDHLHLAMALWESSPARIAYLPHFYREGLANLIGLYTLIGNLDQVPLLLKRMEQIPVQGQRAEMLAFCDTELQYQLYLMNSGQLEAVAEREEQVIAGLNRFAGLVVESKELSLLYNLGITHLLLGQDKDALRYFNRIRDKGRLASRLDLQSTARIFRLLLLLEKDDTSSFHHYLRSNKRSFRSHMPTFNMMEAVYDWLDRYANDFHTALRHQHLTELRSLIVPFEQERVMGAEEILLWTRSRMEGRKMIDLMREQKARSANDG
jgi:tetratricopeptide (TPR) repeat protein